MWWLWDFAISVVSFWVGLWVASLFGWKLIKVGPDGKPLKPADPAQPGYERKDPL